MASLKGERVASDMLRELGMLMLTEVKDELFKGVTLTACEVTNDLSFAKVYFINNNEAETKIVERELNNASGYFRTMLADRLDIRHTPEIKFIYDESIEYGKKIEAIIDSIHEKEAQ